MRAIDRLLRGVFAGLIFASAILVGLITADPALNPGTRAVIWALWIMGSVGAWVIVEDGR